MAKIKGLPQRINKALLGARRSRERSFEMKRTMSKIRAAKRNSVPTAGARNVGGVLIGGPQGPERKKYEVATAFTNVNTGAPYVASVVSAIAQGTAVNQRVGDRVHLKAVDIQFNVQNSGGAVPTSFAEFLDVFLILDTSPDQALATAAQIFQTPSTNLTYINLDDLERFQILRRERIVFDTAGGYSQAFTFHLSAELAVRWGASGAPISNDILVCALSPSTNTVSNMPAISYISRVTYTDE